MVKAKRQGKPKEKYPALGKAGVPHTDKEAERIRKEAKEAKAAIKYLKQRAAGKPTGKIDQVTLARWGVLAEKQLLPEYPNSYELINRELGPRRKILRSSYLRYGKYGKERVEEWEPVPFPSETKDGQYRLSKAIIKWEEVIEKKLAEPNILEKPPIIPSDTPPVQSGKKKPPGESDEPKDSELKDAIHTAFETGKKFWSHTEIANYIESKDYRFKCDPEKKASELPTAERLKVAKKKRKLVSDVVCELREELKSEGLTITSKRPFRLIKHKK